jgi:DNA-binding HxlR family transcriptional regulator
VSADGKPATVRSERKPRHGWFDYEVLDVFGDELGPYGITVYMVLARLCYGGFRVTLGIRELAAHARMSKSALARTLKQMADIGLVVEHKGPTLKSVSSYDLMDVKDLVEEVRALAKKRGAIVNSVPPRDRREKDSSAEPEDAPGAALLTNPPDFSGDAATGAEDDLDGTEELEPPDAAAGAEALCPPQGQISDQGPDAVEKPENSEGNGPPPGTDVSQNEARRGTDLSLSRGPIYRQEGSNQRNKKKSPQLLPPPEISADGESSPALPSRGEGASKPPFSYETGPDPGQHAQTLWAAFIAKLKSEMYDIPIGVEGAKRWKQVIPGEHDWRACFSAWWLLEVERGRGAGALFITYADDEAATEAGIAKYGSRLRRLLRKIFSLSRHEAVSFKVLRAKERKAAPAKGEEGDGAIPAGDRDAWAQVQRLAKEHLARLAKVNPGIKPEWSEQAIEPARLAAVEAVDGKRVWKLRSPAPGATRAVIELLKQTVVRTVTRDVEIVVLEGEGESQ